MTGALNSWPIQRSHFLRDALPALAPVSSPVLSPGLFSPGRTCERTVLAGGVSASPALSSKHGPADIDRGFSVEARLHHGDPSKAGDMDRALPPMSDEESPAFGNNPNDVPAASIPWSTVHQYRRSGSFGATCEICRIGTDWDGPERLNPSPCRGS